MFTNSCDTHLYEHHLAGRDTRRACQIASNARRRDPGILYDIYTHYILHIIYDILYHKYIIYHRYFIPCLMYHIHIFIYHISIYIYIYITVFNV